MPASKAAVPSLPCPRRSASRRRRRTGSGGTAPTCLALREPGEGVLALWREIAWTPEGKPKPKFRLKAAEILKARAEVAAALGDLD